MTDLPFDIVLIAAALIAAMIAARKSARLYIYFAAALYGALGVGDTVAALSGTPALASAIALLVSALAPASLAIAASAGRGLNPILAALLLPLCAIAGIFASLSGAALFAFAPLFASVCAMLVIALRTRSLHACIGAVAFLAAAAGIMADAQLAFLLFSAAGLLGIALGSGARIVNPRQPRVAAAVSAQH